MGGQGEEDEEAATRFRAVLLLQPGNPLALNNLAWLLVKQGKLSRERLDEAIGRDLARLLVTSLTARSAR